LLRRPADGVPPLVAEPPSHIDIAQKAVAHFLYAVLQRGRGAGLAALLTDAVVVARRSDHLLGLEHVVRAGFFDVHILCRPGKPTQPTRTVSLGLLGAARADPLAAAELIRKCRLFMVVLTLTPGTITRQPGTCRAGLAGYRSGSLCPASLLECAKDVTAGS
jgi:hypothetical protein